MTAPPDDTTTDLHTVIAALRAERDAALAREAKRDTDYAERAAHHAATAEVLRAMAASPGDPKPVFEVIARRACDLCDAYGASLAQVVDGSIVLRAYVIADEAEAEEHEANFPRPVAADTMFGRAILAREPVQLPDVAADQAYALREGTLRGAVRAQAAVPLMRDRDAVGAINITRRQTGEFSQAQIELLQVFANQAVIAITSAETYRALQTRTSDLQETLEYQTATSDVLKVISRSTFDLQPVLDTLVATAKRLCNADMAIIYRRVGDAYRLAANLGFPREYEAFARTLSLLPSRASVTQRAALERRISHVADIAADPEYELPEAYELGNARTALGVPLLREGEPVGVFTLARQRVEPFSEKEIALVSTFADQAVIAIENTRLITEQREALEQQTATAEVLQVINASPGNLVPVFDAILEKAHSLCDIAQGSLELYDGGRFRAVAVRGLSDKFTEMLRRGTPAADNPATRPLIEGSRFAHIRDVAETDYWVTRSAAALDAVRTLLCVPLRRDGLLLGMIASARREVRPFSEKEIALLENFAAQAVIAMENARLLTEQREALEQQTATAEVLQVINSSPGDLQPVFSAMVERAATLCEADEAAVRTFDGSALNLVATHGPADIFEELMRLGPSHPDGLYEAIAQGASVTHFVDVRETEAFQTNARARERLELRGIRSWLAVALRKEDDLLGVINVHRREPFTEKQIALLQNFAAQAVIAMDNARLLTEQREALEQQTATAEVLQVINASPGDLAPVFDAMLEKAMRLCGAAYGVLRSFDGERAHLLASRGVPLEYAGFLARNAALGTPPAGTDFMRALQTGQPTQTMDVRESVGYRNGAGGGRAIAELGGARTVLHVPLVKDLTAVGLFTMYRQEVRGFSDKQIALLQNFAAQAVIAMENARLITETREALEQQTATADVLRAINASPGELAPVFDAIGEKAIKLCDATAGALMLPDGDRFRAVALGGVPEAYAEYCRNSPDYGRPNPGSLPARMLAGEDVVHIKDITDVNEYGPADTPSARALAELGGGRTLLGVALRKDDKFFGMITIFRQAVRPFSDRQVVLLQSFAEQAVIAMENARLLEEVRQRQEELRITFENMGDGVAMFDETQYLAAWNRKFQDILDLPDALLGQRRTYEEHLRFLAARGDFGPGVDTVEQINELVASTGRPYGYERTRPDGRVIEIRRNPVPGGGFVLIYSDITERKRSEEEIRAARVAAETALHELRTAQANLIQAEKMASLGQLTAGIAHEIKNPLNFVNNFAALSVDLLGELKETAAPGFAALTEEQRAEVEEVSVMLTSNLEKITEHGKRADGIVKAMLEHSRGSSGERRMVDLNALIDEALNLAYHGARAQDQSFNITLERDFGAGIAPIEVNPQDITRVFLNIFGNGFYAATRRAREGGDAAFVPILKVTTRDTGEAVEIRVRDNGTGIPADIRDKLFQPFFTTKPTGEGTGLGLSITYDIVTQQHGGSIGVDSKVGEYSEFTIRLPRNP